MSDAKSVDRNASGDEAPRAVEAGRYDAFLSYAREDGVFAEQLRNALGEQGRRLWVDVEEIIAGSDWRARLTRGIEACKAVVFVISPDSLASEFCQAELQAAQGLNKLVIPVYRRPVHEDRLPKELSERQWIFAREEDAPDAVVTRLLEALDSDHDWRDRHTRLAGRAREWLDGGRERSFLLRGTELAAAERWLSQQAGHEEQATPEQAEYVIESRRASSRRQRGIIGVAALGALIAAALAVFAFAERNRATQQKELAISRSLAAQSKNIADRQLDQAALLAVEAYRAGPTIEARQAVLETLPHLSAARPQTDGPAGPFTTPLFGPGDGQVTAAAPDGSIQVWDSESGSVVDRFPARDAAGEMALSDDGQILADGRPLKIVLWDTESHDVIGNLKPGTGQAPYGMAISHDGTMLAASGEIGIRVWDLRTRKMKYESLYASLPDKQGFVYGVAFSPNDQLLAGAGYDGAVRLWDTSTGRQVVSPMLGHRGVVQSVAFNNAGTALASGGADTTVRLWDVATGAEIATLDGHRGGFASLAFRPADDALASVSYDGTLRLWNLETRRSGVMRIERSSSDSDFGGSALGGATLSDDVDLLATVVDGRLRLWEIDGVAIAGDNAVSFETGVDDAVISARDDWVVLSGLDGTVTWDRGERAIIASTAEGGDPTVITEDEESLVSGDDRSFIFQDPETLELQQLVTHSPDPNSLGGKPIAIDSIRHRAAVAFDYTDPPKDHPVVVWDTRTGNLIANLTGGSRYGMWTMAFSPDGTQLAAIGDANDLKSGESPFVYLWDTTDWSSQGAIDAETELVSLAYSPDGKVLATGGGDGTVRFWDPSTREAIGQPLRGHTGEVKALGWSPDGTVLASGGEERTIRLWDRSTRQQLGAALTGHSDWITAATFVNSGKTLVSVDTKGYIRQWDNILWSDDLQALTEEVCRHVGHSLSRDEWRALNPGEPYHETCA